MSKFFNKAKATLHEIEDQGSNYDNVKKQELLQVALENFTKAF